MEYLTTSQLCHDIESCPEQSTLLHYISYKIQACLEKKGTKLEQQLLLEQFIDYCTQLWNFYNPDEILRTDDVMTRLCAMWHADEKSDKILTLWRASRGV